MTLTERFLHYAQEFESTFKDDDWTRLAQFFTEDAVYEVKNTPFDCRVEGREAIFRAIKKSVDGFDRKMKERKIELLEPPKETEDTVTIHWAVHYKVPDGSPIRIEAHTYATYRDGLMTHLVDDYIDAGGRDAARLMEELGLDVSYV